MLLLLPFVAFMLLFACFYRGGVSKRHAFLSAALVSGVLLLALTEILSAFKALTAPALAIAWGLLVALTVYLLSRIPSHERNTSTEPLSLFLWFVVLITGLIIVVVGVTAVIAPPNNWDSMTYHMGRVAHWIDNQSVAHYPTHIQRQLYQHPWAEFAITHLQLLSGGDRFAHLVQWFAMLGSVIGVSAVAQKLGASARGQVFAGLICATIPMVILQGSSTQNDLVVSFWVLCTAYFITHAATRSISLGDILCVCAAAGLALATKATAYIYLMPLGVWFGILLLPCLRERWKPAAAGVVLIALLNGGHLARNYTLYGSFTGPEIGMYTNQIMSPTHFISNVVRNVGLHIAAPSGIEQRFQVSSRLTQAVQELHEQLGIAVDDPATTIWYTHIPFMFFSFSVDEDSTAAPVHLLLTILAIILYILRYRTLQSSIVTLYAAAAVAAFVLFCLILKWQPWHNRLHTPIFVLLAPFAGYVLAKGMHVLFSSAVLALAVLLALTPLLNNATRPLSGEASILNADRWSMYFRKRPEIQPVYEGAMETIQQLDCSLVGLYISGDTWEYPLWAYSHAHGNFARFEHVSTPYFQSDVQPCAIVRDITWLESTEEFELNGQTYIRAWYTAPLDVLVPSTE